MLDFWADDDDVFKCGQFSINKHEQLSREIPLHCRLSGPDDDNGTQDNEWRSGTVSEQFLAPPNFREMCSTDRIVLADEDVNDVHFLVRTKVLFLSLLNEDANSKCYTFHWPNSWRMGRESVPRLLFVWNVNYIKTNSSRCDFLGPGNFNKERAPPNKSQWLSGAIKSALVWGHAPLLSFYNELVEIKEMSSRGWINWGSNCLINCILTEELIYGKGS